MKRNKNIPNVPDRSMPTIDLFCGAGGLSLGAARAGLDVVAGVEMDSQALATHIANFPTTIHIQRDVSTISGADLLISAGIAKGELTALIGGPPCQGFSVIGARQPNDARNSLFGHFMRLVSETEPMFFVAENVPGIAYSQNKVVLRKALAHVPKFYQMLPPVIVAGDEYGAPTSRKRLFFIGLDLRRFHPISPKAFAPPRDVAPVLVQDALRGLSTKLEPPSAAGNTLSNWQTVDKLPRNRFYSRVYGVVPPNVGQPEALRRYKARREVNGHIAVLHADAISARYGALAPGEKDPVSRSVRLKLDGFCPTLRAGTGSEKGRRQAVRPVHPTEARVISPREAARLQGFPDWFLLPTTKWHSFRQIGNSVSPIVAEAVLAVLVQHVQANQLNETETAPKNQDEVK